MCGAQVTAAHAMHPSRVDGLAMYAVVGDSTGRLYFVTPQQGDVVAEHDAGCAASPSHPE